MLLPKDVQEEINHYNEESFQLLHDNPWLIPAILGCMTLPAAVCIHGFWKNQQLKKQLKIEREKTRQLNLQNKHSHLLLRHL
ncbi:hypothetical protein FD33_GL001200 [Companilactobacillus paralimentarius DSM 13238 = JCM 10415]|jgi:hypothetical protein|uniref:Transposase n=1 Tax=Companilactobacillus paralimentarius DSM 13238 = JCM 10415 TaxID=1122151 RepID=A0A0R1PP33_9LACO|nr:hypothetical protein [Companilactobacillus paralimentarius]KAE9565195.1 hypothetical protein ATN96_04745 [Companilactobacillus paralimentarius]KRL32068.1 hypothetical protein FD33_GL001200 [Companilactobacillus paralimentarius DSM 13238 = JCM 10415]MDR4933483.1 transposase [Companilactobacillus paralimentarius]QFR69965.1 transposase [Companilactobacillus paralimentarius]